MNDFTAQPEAADPILEAANAFKAFDNPQPVSQPRDEAGRFAAQQNDPEPEPEEIPDDAGEQEEGSDQEEAQPDPVEMPTSWGADDRELWQSLPVEAQARIAEREAQRDRGVNLKLQEAALARKAYEAQVSEANAAREKWAQEYDTLVSHIQLEEPDPRHFGAGTGHYDREAYDLALANYRAQSNVLSQLRQQREQIRTEQQQQEQQAFAQWKSEVDAQFGPKLVEIMPDLTDATRAPVAMKALVDYAVSQGIAEAQFAPENHGQITAAELAILAKARKYDELVASKGKPAPKAAQPPVRPGVAPTRSAQSKAAKDKVFQRLASEGSIEAGAAAFKALGF